MPIYEYRCAGCGHQEDHLQKVSDRPLAKCPACGKRSYKKQLSAAGFQLKGSGWYATDFKTTGKKSETKPQAATEAKTDTKPKAETKPDPKRASTPATTD